MVRARNKRKSCRISVGKPDGKMALDRGRLSWEDSINIGLKEEHGLDLSDSGYGEVAGCCEDSIEF